MNTYEHHDRATALVPNKTRWLAIMAGAVTGLAGALPYGPVFVLFPSILILGAIVQRWSPSRGRWLMWMGAFFVTVDFGLFLAPQGILGIRSLDSSLDLNFVGLIVLVLASAALVGWCDVALVVDARRTRRAPRSTEPDAPRTPDRIVWVVALCLSTFVAWNIVGSVFAYREYERLDTLLVAIAFAIAVLFFDAKLIVNAIRTRRTTRL